MILGIAIGPLLLAQPNGGVSALTGKSATNEVPKIEYEKYTLPNGLQVILHVDRKLPVVHVNQWYHVGSKNERFGRTGFAHLFEHMMFQGSKHADGEYFTYVEKAGANLATGGVNGTTSYDRTNYFATVPSGNLEYLLWLESDRLATLADALTKEKLDNQRDVVKNERRQSLENQPYGRAFKLIDENLFPAGHPYSHDVIGSHEDLTAASLEDVQQFFRTYYTPNNLSLVIAGNFDVDEAKRLVEKYFAGIPAGPALDRPGVWVPKLDGEKIMDVKDRVPQERTYISWVTPPGFSEDEAPLDMAVSTLTDGLSSRLQKALIYDKQLCSDLSGFNLGREIAGNLTITATARPGASLAQIEQIITDEIARLAKSGPTEEELSRAKARWEYQFVSGLERIGGFGGKADLLNMYNTMLGDPNGFDKDLARYRGVTVESVRQAVGKWINNRNRLIVRFHPETSGRSTVADIDRTTPPELGTDQMFKTPEVETVKLDNGIDVFVVHRPELPKVAVALATHTGGVADPAGKEGLASLTASLLNKGTKTRKALDISDQLGNLGVYLNASASREYSIVSFEALKRSLAPAMEIVSDVVRNPIFPDTEIDRAKKRQLDALAQQENDPNSLSFRVARVLMFGREHPYGRPTNGWNSTVPGLTRDDVARFYQTYWKPGGAALVFVGDISQAEAVEMAKKYLGGWSGGAPPTISIPAPQPVAGGKIYLVDRQDAAQTVVQQMLPIPPRKSEDYYAIRLADAVYGGGGFATRLNLNLREDKGYTYGVFSFPTFNAKAGIWSAYGGIQTDKTKPAIVEFANELKNINGAKPITDAELVKAKEGQLRGLAQEYETLGQIAGALVELWADEMPLSEMSNAPAELQKTPLASVNAAAHKYADPGHSVMLLVGDRNKVEAGLRELNMGEVVIVDNEGRVVGEGRMGQK
jgi:zinc protease